MLAAQLNPRALVINVIDRDESAHLALTAEGQVLVPIRDGASVPTSGQRYDVETDTFADDPQWLTERFERMKAGRLSAVSQTTANLMGRGFEWNGAHIAIGGDSTSDLKIIYDLRDVPGVLPVEHWGTVEGTTVRIADAAEMAALYFAALGYGRLIRETGAQLAAAIQAAATQAELDAIVDTRV